MYTKERLFISFFSRIKKPEAPSSYPIAGSPSQQPLVDSSSINTLPDDLLLHIFQHLPFRNSFGTCREVCWRWNVLIGGEMAQKAFSKKILSKIGSPQAFFTKSYPLFTDHALMKKTPQHLKGVPLRSVVLTGENKKKVSKRVYEKYVASNPYLLNLTLNSKPNSKLLSKFDGRIFKKMDNNLLILHIEGVPEKYSRCYEISALIRKCTNLRYVHIGDSHLLRDFVVEAILKNNPFLEILSLSSGNKLSELTTKSLNCIRTKGRGLRCVKLCLKESTFPNGCLKNLIEIENLYHLTIETKNYQIEYKNSDNYIFNN